MNIQTCFRRLCLPAALLLWSGFPLLEATPSFVIDEQRVLVDFENFSIDDPIWGNADIQAKSPRQPTVNTSNIAMQATGSERWNAFSPQLTVTPAFEVSDTLYFSGWFNIINSTSSGGRIRLANTTAGGSGAVSLGGFGIVDASGHAFSAYRRVGDSNVWMQSEVSALPNVWYEIALVVQLNAEDISKSLSYYFVRNVTAGESEFTMLEDLSGLEMDWYTEELNATHFEYWRVENFRNGAQVDNLAAGTAILTIPEPATVMAWIGGLLAAGVLLRRRCIQKRRNI